MTFIADLHIHSRYSRATSQELCFEQLHAWGRRKGVEVIGTGDCTHPGWLAEMHEKLLPEGDGLFRLREELIPIVEMHPAAESAEVRFLITGEISTIYKAGGATRKVHHVVCLPGLEEAERFAERLERIGNIRSDGRPILGLDSRDLLEVLLEASPTAVLIPAHIWTPWFSVLGSKSGFDTIEDCYRDLSAHIFALETGLSSDPPMNWMVAGLDRYALVSNSDAHSPQKLGREANVFTCEMGYSAMMNALRRVTPGFWGTLEFFPEEGKYHFDGHRKCDFLCAPEESKRLNGRCPHCGGLLTLGVEYRVTELADRPKGTVPPGAFGYQSLLSLGAILGEVLETGATSKKALLLYDKLLSEVGPELYILREAELTEIKAAGGELLALAIEKMRSGNIHATPGYDGEYGIIKVFSEEERAQVLGQIQLFGGLAFESKKKSPPKRAPEPQVAEPPVDYTPAESGLSEEQQQAIHYPPAPLVIVAGPGAGKTRTLVERIARLVTEEAIAPVSILALTFSNRAGREMAERLGARLGDKEASTPALPRSAYSTTGPHPDPPPLRKKHSAGEGELLLIPETARNLHPSPTPHAVRGAGEGPGMGARNYSQPTVATFHKIGFTIISEQAERLGLRTHLRILAEEEAEELFRENAAGDSAPNLDVLEQSLSEIFTGAAGDADSLRVCAERARELTPSYTAAKQERGVLDFTDLLILPLMLLAEDEAVRQSYQQRWQHVFVDEYQDVNVLQYLLLRLLCPPGSDLCVIGDPDQAIYGFRGADVGYFLRFHSDYPKAGQIALTRNYRSCKTIVDAGAQVIARHSLLGERKLWSDIPGPAQLEVTALPTPGAEAEYVVQTIEGLLGGISHFSVDSGRSGDGVGMGLGFSDIAVLYRTHALGDELQQALQRSGIPYQRAARKDVFGRADVRRALALLAEMPEEGAPAALLLSACFTLGIKEETLGQPPWSLLHRYAQEAEDLATFFRNVNFERDIDLYDPRAARVALMTVHAAKGLEWDIVFLAGCEEGSFPHPAADIDEERRLFYVGMTRARAQLYLSYAETRVLRGERASRRISPFVRDIDTHLLHITKPHYRHPVRNTQLAMNDLFDE
ncbi:MAG: UvrD-helicase domain-containing protein [Armatimonadota bacterium]